MPFSGGKTAMIFVTLLTKDREHTEEVGSKFRGILKEVFIAISRHFFFPLSIHVYMLFGLRHMVA